MALTTEDLNSITTIVNSALVSRVEPRFDAVDARLDRMDVRFDRMDERMDRTDERVNHVEVGLVARMNRMESRLLVAMGRLERDAFARLMSMKLGLEGWSRSGLRPSACAENRE